jgi:hypothetical protein
MYFSFLQYVPQAPLISFYNMCHRHHSSLSPWSDHLNNVYWRLQLWNSSLCGFLQFPFMHPSWAQKSSSAPIYRMPSAFVLL